MYCWGAFRNKEVEPLLWMFGGRAACCSTLVCRQRAMKYSQNTNTNVLTNAVPMQLFQCVGYSYRNVFWEVYFTAVNLYLLLLALLVVVIVEVVAIKAVVEVVAVVKTVVVVVIMIIKYLFLLFMSLKVFRFLAGH